DFQGFWSSSRIGRDIRLRAGAGLGSSGHHAGSVRNGDARCRLLAEGANPDPGTPTIYTGKLGRDIGLNAAAGLAHGTEQGAAVQHTHDLCMQAAGYVARAVGAPQPAAA